MAGFVNPVLPGFHPDPSVCRVGEAYYLACSSFTYVPGVPIFRSPDLVHWDQIGNALERPSQLDMRETVLSTLGVCAPTIRYHDDRFWLITSTIGGPGAGSFFVTADDPAGPWSDPVSVPIPGIDPDLAWDDDDRCWVTLSGIQQCRIDDRTGEIIEQPTPTWSGTGLQYPEGPHLYKREGSWYLLVSEGGTERGHAVSIARGPTPAGPWEGCPSNPILSHRSTARPVQNTGHADLVEAADGSWWMVLLGVRPRGMTPGYHVLGRETFLVPVDWDAAGWPVVGRLDLEVEGRPPGWREPAPDTDTSRDDFGHDRLHPRWLAIRRWPADEVSLAARPGWLTLRGTSATLDDPLPVFVGRRQQHERARVRARLEVDGGGGGGVEGGVAVRMDEHAHYEVGLRGGEVIVRARIGPLGHVVARATRPGGPVVIGFDIEPQRGFGGPDTIFPGYDAGDGFTRLAELDGRYLSTESAGGFLGRVIGMYAVGGTAHFDWFDYEGFGAFGLESAT